MTRTIATARLGEHARRLRTGDLDPDQAVARARERFEAVEPAIEAFVPEGDGGPTGDGADRWARLDRDRRRLLGRVPDDDPRPPLYGVPVGVKDIFHVDGLPTRAGSDLPPGALQGPEAASVAALREAGALVLGKTVTTEFAWFDPGPTRNPHDTDHTPGGSSSGSAAAVAAGVCPLALGSQTIGSVNRPAAFCGVVGVKPSFERIPIDGVLPVAPSVDHVGFFTQDLPGARLAASVLYDEWHPGSEPDRRPTIGAVDGPYLDQADPAGREGFETHVERLEAAGYDVRRIDLFPEIEAVNERHRRIVAAETALSHADLYPEYGDRYAAATVDLIEEGKAVAVGALCDARAGRAELRRAVHDRTAEAGVDLVVSPAAPGPAPEGIDSTGDPVMNLPWTHAGLPSVTVPASTTDDGLPIGLQVAAPFGEDEWLLAACEGIRAALDGRDS